jgi:hypothetical protein
VTPVVEHEGREHLLGTTDRQHRGELIGCASRLPAIKVVVPLRESRHPRQCAHRHSASGSDALPRQSGTPGSASGLLWTQEHNLRHPVHSKRPHQRT